MFVVFALTIQSLQFRVEICNSNSQMFYRAAGKLDMNLHVSLWCVLTAVEESYSFVFVGGCVCACL